LTPRAGAHQGDAVVRFLSNTDRALRPTLEQRRVLADLVSAVVVMGG